MCVVAKAPFETVEMLQIILVKNKNDQIVFFYFFF